MKKFLKNFCMLAAFAVVFSVAGCGGDDDDNTNATDVLVTSVEIQRVDGTPIEGGEISLLPKGRVGLKAVVLPADATNKKVTWRTDKESDIVTVTADGLVDATKTPGETKVWCESEDGEASDFVTVIVEDVDYAKEILGKYVGNLEIDDNQLEMDFELVYKDKNEITFSKEGVSIDAGLIDPTYAGTPIEGIEIVGEITVEEFEDGTYYLSGEGELKLPEWLLQPPFNLGVAALPFNIEPREDGTQEPTLKNGHLYLRFWAAMNKWEFYFVGDLTEEEE